MKKSAAIKHMARIYLWFSSVVFAILLMFRARIIWPEHPTILTVLLLLFAVSSTVMLVDTVRRGKPLQKPARLHPLPIVLTVVAVITTLFALLGLFYYISPTLFIRLMSLLPPSIQEAMFMDFLLRGGTGFWIFAIVSGVLWYIVSLTR